MSCKISASDIKNIHLYNGTTDSHELKLCRTHRSQLSHLLVKKLDALVTTTLFQSQFKDFLPRPDSDEEVHVKIHITESQLIVQKLDHEGAMVQSKTIDLKRIRDLDNDIHEVQEINQTILHKANTIYQKHLNERHRKDSASPLGDRTSRYRSGRRHRSRSPFSVDRKSNRDRSFSPRLRRASSLSPRKNSDLHRHQRKTHSSLPVSPLGSPRQGADSADESTPDLSHSSDTIKSTASLSNQCQPSKRESERSARETRNEKDVLKAHPSEDIPSIQPAEFDQLMASSQALSADDKWGSTHFLTEDKEKFMKLPEAIRYAIYYQTYLLVDPSEFSTPWPIGQTLFEATSPETAMNLCRAHAIRHFLLHTLAIDFASLQGNTPSPELLRRFNMLPEEDKMAVYEQLGYLQTSGPSYKGAAYAFSANDHFSATNKQRATAIARVASDRIAGYHRHHYRTVTQAMSETFRDAYEKLQREMAQKNLEIATLRRQ